MAGTNPQKVNQYTEPDLRQSTFLKYYFDPKSKTFGKAKASGLKAGYEREYAENIMSIMPDWLSVEIEKRKDKNLIEKAEKNLEIFLDGEDEKIKADITKFVLTRLNKQKYSERTEITGKDGEKLIPQPIINVSTDNSNQKDIVDVEENTSGSGGDIREQNSLDSLIPNS